MKKVALMQPYLFPYIGYFQLINAVDEFIIYDDVQWIKGGWINRNRILESNGVGYITLPVKKDSLTKNINERNFADTVEFEKNNILDRITAVYSNAPYFDSTISLIKRIFSYKEDNAALFIENSLRECCQYLNIPTRILVSSDLDKDNNLKSQARVININEAVGSRQYINAIGGQELYDKDTFSKHGIELSFIKSGQINYKQFDQEYVPNLSIIDVMMFNSIEEISEMLDNYELV